MTFIPLTEMMPQTTTKNTADNCGAGMAEIKVESFPDKPNKTNHAPAATKTLRLATPVIEIIPAFVEE